MTETPDQPTASDVLRDTIRAAVLTVACPACASAPGTACTGDGLAKKPYHPSRVKALWDERDYNVVTTDAGTIVKAVRYGGAGHGNRVVRPPTKLPKDIRPKDSPPVTRTFRRFTCGLEDGVLVVTEMEPGPEPRADWAPGQVTLQEAYRRARARSLPVVLVDRSGARTAVDPDAARRARPHTE